MKKIINLFLVISLLFVLSNCKKDSTNDNNNNNNNNNPNTVKDYDGNQYNTVTIGTQVWMKENLKTTKYNDGTPIPLITDNTEWTNLYTAGYCFYNNDADTYKSTYGTLYNWYAVNTGKLCPLGWHIPNNEEWRILTDYLGGESVAGGKIKEAGTSHWDSPNTGATNESGLSILPGGRREYVDGQFYSLGHETKIWSSTEGYLNGAYYWWLNYNDAEANEYYSSNAKTYGISVRCLKD